MVKKKSINDKKRIELSAILFLTIIIAFIILLVYYSPEEIIDYIGLTNGYLIVLIGGFLGGISILFPFPNYLLVITFGAAGLNPLLLGISATVGIILGESTSYFVGRSSHPLLHQKFQKYLSRFNLWLLKLNPKVASIVLFFVGCVPIPNDIVVIPLGLANYPFWKTIIPIGLGNLAYNLILASIGYYGLFI